MPRDYGLVQPSPTNTLDGISHSQQHARTATAIGDLDRRIEVLELGVPARIADIEAARRVVLLWEKSGVVGVWDGRVHRPLWNLAERGARYVSAKASVAVPPEGAGIEIDLVVANELNASPTLDSILVSPLVIPDGAYESAVVGVVGFTAAELPVGSFVTAQVLSVGSSVAGEDLIVQVDALL